MNNSSKMTDILDSCVEETRIDAVAFLSWDKKSLSLIDIFKPVLYPVDLFRTSENSGIINSLVRMCFINITRDDEFLTRKYLSIPINLYDSLMTFAIDSDFHRSIAVLMSRWPYENFSIAKLIPNALATWNNLVDEKSKLECLSNATKKYTRCLTTFLDFVKNDSKSPLRLLDMRGMPMGDGVMNYLLREITSLANDVLSVDNYHILLDGVICTLDTYRRVICHLASQKPKLHLHFNKLDLSHVGEIKSWMLLRQIDPKELAGLSVRATLPTRNFCKLITIRFTELTALEIINLDFRRSIRSKPLSLRFLQNLQRLSFFARTHYFSDVIRSSDIKRLEYLELNDKMMSVMKTKDLEFLASFPLQFCELNLFGHYIVERDIPHWVKLFNLLVPTLKIAELEECLIKETMLQNLLACIYPLLNLRYLNLGKNPIRMQTLCGIAPELSSMPALELVRLPYIDESLMHVSVPDDVSPKLRLKTIEEIFETKKSTPVNIVWAPCTPNWL